MSNPQSLPIHFRVVATMSIMMFLGGCHERLAEKHAFFAPMGDPGTAVSAETERIMTYNLALQAAQRGCLAQASSQSSTGDVSSGRAALSGTQYDEDERAHQCAERERTHAARGSAANAYRRWVEDRVRELPAPSETAQSVGSGS